MKGDFTRVTFDPAKHFSRVLMQQGRVTLDADYNEQTDILLHYVRTLARDLIGPYAAPIEDAGFKLRLDKEDLWIGKGRYYVDGILVENDGCYYAAQPDPPFSAEDGLLAEIKDKKDKPIWIYLDVWERHISFIEDDAIREKALNGPDTCTRAKVVWQVRALPVDAANVALGGMLTEAQLAESRKYLAVRADKLTTDREKLLNEPPPISDEQVVLATAIFDINLMQKEVVKPNAAVDFPKYLVDRHQKLIDERAPLLPGNPIDLQLRGLNARISEIEIVIEALGGTDPGAMTCDAPLDQLLPVSKAWLTARVDPGQRTDNACVTPPDSKYRGTENQLYRVEIHDGGTAGTATFKWSRDNGSVASAWLGTFGNDLKVSRTRGFKADNWVELTDDRRDLQGTPGVLVKLKKVEGDTLSVDDASGITWSNQLKNPKVRRWDQSENASTTLIHGVIPIKEGSDNAPLWVNLEDGIQISFSKGGTYRTGDYWLIPARVATGKIEWPGSKQTPDARQPHGIEHHYAPLGFVSWKENKWQLEKSCGCVFKPQSSCFQPLPEKVKTSPKPAPVRKRRRK